MAPHGQTEQEADRVDPPAPREVLTAEAADLARQILHQFVLLIGAGFFMLVTISVSDLKLISGEEKVTLPIVDAPTTLSSLVIFGSIMISGLLIYTHFLLGRLEQLRAQGIRPPRTYFFTMRDPVTRLCADFCFYMVVPLFCLWFAIRTVFRPETPWLLLLSGALLVVMSMLLMLRALRHGSRLRRRIALGYVVLAGVLTTAGLVAFALEGRAPFQRVMMTVAKLDLEGADLAGSIPPDVTLDGFGFDGMCLRGARLDGLSLNGASFVGADLTDASLKGAKLAGANFNEADLTEARLEGAKLNGATFVGARLSASILAAPTYDARSDDPSTSRPAILGYAARLAGRAWRMPSALSGPRSALPAERDTLPKAELTGADLTDADLRRIQAAGVTFDKADLTRAVLDRADLAGASLLRVKAPSARFRFARLSHVVRDQPVGATFMHANLECADLREVRGEGVMMAFAAAQLANFSDATLPGARFVNATLNGADFTRADLTDAILGNAKIEGTIFDNALLKGASGFAPALEDGSGGAVPEACPKVEERMFVLPTVCSGVSAAAAE